MTFYTGAMFPSIYNSTIFNAQHGSWDRDVAIGYRVMNIGVSENGSATSYAPFATGWLNSTLAPSNKSAWGTPRLLQHIMWLFQAGPHSCIGMRMLPQTCQQRP